MSIDPEQFGIIKQKVDDICSDVTDIKKDWKEFKKDIRKWIYVAIVSPFAATFLVSPLDVPEFIAVIVRFLS